MCVRSGWGLGGFPIRMYFANPVHTCFSRLYLSGEKGKVKLKNMNISQYVDFAIANRGWKTGCNK